MSDTKRYTPSMKVGHMVKDSDGLWIRSQDYDEAQSQLAALREELATAKRNEANSEVGYKAAIEKQEELRTELADSEEELDTVIHHNIDLQQRLADAERRNAVLTSALYGLVKINEEHNAAMAGIIGKPAGWNDSYLDAARAALNPNPEAASHD